MLLLIQYTLIFASVLLLVALGGCISEHSGVINLGLEGIMVVGALGGALVMSSLGTASAVVMVLVAMLAAILAGMLYSCLLGVAAIHFKADQTLVGTAMNLLATAAATVFVKAMNTAANPDNHSSEIEYIRARKMFIVNINGFEFNWFMLVAVIAVVLVYFLLYKNRLGLRLMACGEHPQAAASVGVNVYKMRWTGVLMSGALGGLGGLCYILAGVSVWKFENGVAGFGFLALAVMIFGQWKPARIAMAGGRERFAQLADRFFGFSHPEDDSSCCFEGFNNETDMESPYVYHFAGRHDRLSEVVDAGLTYMYVEGRGGVPGNNDSGGLCSCYLWNAIGVFPISGQDLMVIGSPRPRETTLYMGNGRTFRVRKQGDGIYVKSAALNGVPLDTLCFSVRKMMEGGELLLTMTPDAKKAQLV